MLMLGRRIGEKIIINEDLIITVSFIDCRARTIKLGFDADKGKYIIDRYEIYGRKLEQRE